VNVQSGETTTADIQLSALFGKGIIAYYPFNGNAQDEIGIGNHGIVNGAKFTTDRFGNPNSAYQFDGVDDYVEVPHTNSFNFANSFTVEAFIKPTAMKDGGIVSRWETGPDEAKTFDFLILNNLALLCEIETSRYFSLSTNKSLQLDKWAHVALVYDGTQVSFYINFELDKSEGLTGNLRNFVQPTVIGAAGATNGGIGRPFFSGAIDEVRISKAALTPDQFIR
jgi:hypothetical protein